MKPYQVTFFDPSKESPFPSGAALSDAIPPNEALASTSNYRQAHPGDVYQLQVDPLSSGTLQQPKMQPDSVPAAGAQHQMDTAGYGAFDYKTQMSRLHSEPPVRRHPNIGAHNDFEHEPIENIQGVNIHHLDAMAKLDAGYRQNATRRGFTHGQRAIYTNEAAVTRRNLNDTAGMTQLDIDHAQGVARRELLESQGMSYKHETTKHGANPNNGPGISIQSDALHPWVGDEFKNSRGQYAGIRYNQAYSDAAGPRAGLQNTEAADARRQDLTIYTDTQRNEPRRPDHLYCPPQESKAVHPYGGDTLYHYRARDGTIQPRNDFQDPDATHADHKNIIVAGYVQKKQPAHRNISVPYRRDFNKNNQDDDTQARNRSKTVGILSSHQQTIIPRDRRPTMHGKMMGQLGVNMNLASGHPSNVHSDANYLSSERNESRHGDIQNKNDHENPEVSSTGQSAQLKREEQQKQLEGMFATAPLTNSDSTPSSSTIKAAKPKGSGHYRNRHGYIMKRSDTGDLEDGSVPPQMSSFSLERSPTGMSNGSGSAYSADKYTDVSVHTIGTPAAEDAGCAGTQEGKYQNINMQNLGEGAFQTYTTQNGDPGQAYDYEARAAGPLPVIDVELLKSKQSVPQLPTLKNKKSFWERIRSKRPKSLESTTGAPMSNEPNPTVQPGPVWNSIDSTKVGNSLETGNHGPTMPLQNSQSHGALEALHNPAYLNITYDGRDPALERVRNKQPGNLPDGRALLRQPTMSAMQIQQAIPAALRRALSDGDEATPLESSHTCGLSIECCNIPDSIARIFAQAAVLNGLAVKAASMTEVQFRLAKIKNIAQNSLKVKIYKEIQTLGTLFKQAKCAIKHGRDALTDIQIDCIKFDFTATCRKLLNMFSAIVKLAVDKNTTKRFRPFNKGVYYELVKTTRMMTDWVGLAEAVLYPVPSPAKRVKVGIHWAAVQKATMAFESWEKLKECDGV